MTVHVFIGPSIDRAQALRLLPAAIFHPPAAMGDIYSAVVAGAESIGLIDGLFDSVPSVWHKEILYALSRGIRVVAGGSMGALRAAETGAFGTEGVGQIFEWYRDGVLEDDDEVVVAHATAADAFRPLSVAMVNLRWGLGLARDRKLICEATHDRLIAAAKARFYPDRSWDTVLRDGAQLGLPALELDRLKRFTVRTKPDLKRRDAEAVLRRLRQRRPKPAGSAPTGGPSNFEFEPTEFWHKLVDSERLIQPPGGGRSARGGAIRIQQLLWHAMLSDPDRDGLRERALDLALRGAEMERRRPELDPRAVARMMRHETTSHRRMPTDDRRRSAELRVVPDALIPKLEGLFVRHFQLALAATGKLSNVVDELVRKRAFLHDRGTPEPTVADTGLTPKRLLHWYEERFGRIRGNLGEHAGRLGFASDEHFLSELGAEYLFDRDVRSARQEPRRRLGRPRRRPTV